MRQNVAGTGVQKPVTSDAVANGVLTDDPSFADSDSFDGRHDLASGLFRNALIASRNVEKQRRFRAKMQAEGMQQVHGWVHVHQLADVIMLIERLRKDPDLDAGPVRRASTGRLEKVW